MIKVNDIIKMLEWEMSEAAKDNHLAMNRVTPNPRERLLTEVRYLTIKKIYNEIDRMITESINNGNR